MTVDYIVLQGRKSPACATTNYSTNTKVAADGLTLHVGISCGELCFGILGGIDNYWECLMSGGPIGLVADALDEAKKQEVWSLHMEVFLLVCFFETVNGK